MLRDKNYPRLVFDIKGSSINRKVQFNGSIKKWWLKKGNKGCKKGMKDMNFVEINKDLNCQLLNLSNELKDKFQTMI